MQHQKIELNSGLKRETLAAELCRQIIGGRWTPGNRFASYKELDELVNVSKATQQQAIAMLQKNGYLIGIERKGLYVADKLPYLHNFTFIFKKHEQNSSFYRKLSDVALQYNAREEFKFDFVNSIDNPEHPDWAFLWSNIRQYRTGGLFFASPPESEREIALESDLSIPKVGFGYHEINSSVIHILIDDKTMAQKVFRYFHEKKAKRIALLMMGEQPVRRFFAESASAFGCETEPMLIHGTPKKELEYAFNLTSILMALPENKRPAGILVNDENILKYVVCALMTVPENLRKNLHVVCRTNFPDHESYPIPIRKIGFDSQEIIASAIEAMRKWHLTGSNDYVHIYPKWENE